MINTLYLLSPHVGFYKYAGSNKYNKQLNTERYPIILHYTYFYFWQQSKVHLHLFNDKSSIWTSLYFLSK